MPLDGTRASASDRNAGQLIAIGGAPSSARVVNWVRSCFWDALVRDSYGTTECGSITANHTVRDTVEFKLVDWNVRATAGVAAPIVTRRLNLTPVCL